MLRRDLREVGSRFLDTPLVEKLNSDSVGAYVPIQKVCCVFKMTKNRDRDVQAWQFFACHRIESRVLHGTKTTGKVKSWTVGLTFNQNYSVYLVMAYSRSPWCRCISLKVPIHPRNFLSLPIFQVTNNGLENELFIRCYLMPSFVE